MLLFVVKCINLPTPPGEGAPGRGQGSEDHLCPAVTSVCPQGCPLVTWMSSFGSISPIPTWYVGSQREMGSRPIGMGSGLGEGSQALSLPAS